VDPQQIKPRGMKKNRFSVIVAYHIGREVVNALCLHMLDKW
jgi:hypothetical protein